MKLIRFLAFEILKETLSFCFPTSLSLSLSLSVSLSFCLSLSVIVLQAEDTNLDPVPLDDVKDGDDEKVSTGVPSGSECTVRGG